MKFSFQVGTNICWMIYQDISFNICLGLFSWNENENLKYICLVHPFQALMQPWSFSIFWRTKFAQMCINYRMGYKARVHNFYTRVYSLLRLHEQYTGVHKLYTGLLKLYRGTNKLYTGVYKPSTGVDKLKRVKVADVTWGLGRRRKGVSCQFVVQGEYIKWTLHSRSSSQDHHVTILLWLDP